MTLAEFRKDKDEVFKVDEHSPIPAEKRKAFSGLVYYPENPALNFILDLDLQVAHEEVIMDTSTGDSRVLKRAGKIYFTVNGEAAELSIFQDASGYFLPFRDATNGSETYGAGRYVEVEEEHGKFRIDFNKAYNPYCAYNPYYSCPIPPRENWLQVRIEAGEKKYT
ncbi:MAG: DUF1684 domain-containing protein [Patescibacteria group bacterium]|jgi:hypothetical protein